MFQMIHHYLILKLMHWIIFHIAVTCGWVTITQKSNLFTFILQNELVSKDRRDHNDNSICKHNRYKNSMINDHLKRKRSQNRTIKIWQSGIILDHKVRLFRHTRDILYILNHSNLVMLSAFINLVLRLYTTKRFTVKCF